jgi:hypothetical protein
VSGEEQVLGVRFQVQEAFSRQLSALSKKNSRADN